MKRQLIAVFAAGLVVPGAAASDYVFTQIDYPGSPTTQVFGINNGGDVVGFGLTDPASPFVYRWRRGFFLDVPPFSPENSTGVVGINDLREIVGWVDGADGPFTSGFVLHTDGTYLTFFHPEAATFTQARAVNNQGLITGIRDALDGSTAGFLYVPSTAAFVDIVPSLFTIAHGLNSAGDVVGSAVFDADGACPGSPAGEYGWRRTPDGSVVYFRVNDHDTEARGINDGGFITGNVLDPITGKQRGFVAKLDASSPCESLPIPGARLLEFPGYDATRPEGIANSGVIVGIVYNNDDVIYHGFIATRE